MDPTSGASSHCSEQTELYSSGSPTDVSPASLLRVPAWPEAHSYSSPDSFSAPCSSGAEWLLEPQFVEHLYREPCPSSTVPPAAGYPISGPQCMVPAGSSHCLCIAADVPSAAQRLGTS